MSTAGVRTPPPERRVQSSAKLSEKPHPLDCRTPPVLLRIGKGLLAAPRTRLQPLHIWLILICATYEGEISEEDGTLPVR